MPIRVKKKDINFICDNITTIYGWIVDGTIAHKQKFDQYTEWPKRRANVKKSNICDNYVPQRLLFTNRLSAKGRLISKCPYEKSVSSKIPTKIFLVTIMGWNDELSWTMSWVGCLLTEYS